MKKDNKGYTLIELLITASIIGILGAVAVSGYIGSTLKAARSEAYSNLNGLRMFEAQFFSENAQYTPNLANFPSFNPGANANFVYAIQGTGIALPALPAFPYNGATVAQANCFIATATGIPGSRVAGDVFAIDCNNNSNY